MIQVGSYLEVADNSGISQVQVIKVPGGSKKRYARVGDIVVVSAKKSRTGITKPKVKKKSVVKAMVVRTKFRTKRKDGSYISFGDNSCILVDIKKGEPVMIGSRILGPLPREIREAGHTKIVSLSKEVY